MYALDSKSILEDNTTVVFRKTGLVLSIYVNRDIDFTLQKVDLVSRSVWSSAFWGA